jgi:hypothetical protein
MDNTALKFEFIPERFKSKKSKFREDLKQQLKNNDKLLLTWLDEFSDYEPSLLEDVVAYPMSCFEGEAYFLVKQHGIGWFCERLYTGKFNPYDEYFIVDKSLGDVVSFTKYEYIEWLRRDDHFNEILDVIENYTYDTIL